MSTALKRVLLALFLGWLALLLGAGYSLIKYAKEHPYQIQEPKDVG